MEALWDGCAVPMASRSSRSLMLAAPVHDQTKPGSVPTPSVEPPSRGEGLSDTNRDVEQYHGSSLLTAGRQGVHGRHADFRTAVGTHLC